MSHHIRTIVLFFALAISIRARAEEALTLSQTLDAVHAGTPATERADAAAEEARYRRWEAFATYLPNLSASANYLTDKKYMITDVTIAPSPNAIPIPNVVPTSIGTVSAQYLLFDGFAGTNTFRAAKANESAAMSDAEWARFQTARDVQMRFFRVIAAQTLKNVAEQNLKVLQDHLRDVTAQKRAGVATNYDLLRVEVQVSEAQSEVLNAGDNVEIARGRLAEALGREDHVNALGELPVLDESLIAGVEATAFESRADLRAMSERVDATSLTASAASRFWVPRVGLFAQYQYYNNRNDEFPDWGNYRNAYMVGVSLNWNLFDGGMSYAKSREVEQQKIQSEKGLRIMQLKARQDLDVWKRKFAYSCSVYKSRLGDIEKSKESVRLAREGRRVGARTTTDLLDAETELYRAQAGAVNAQIGAIEALVNVELSTGRSLYKF